MTFFSLFNRSLTVDFCSGVIPSFSSMFLGVRSYLLASRFSIFPEEASSFFSSIARFFLDKTAAVGGTALAEIVFTPPPLNRVRTNVHWLCNKLRLSLTRRGFVHEYRRFCRYFLFFRDCSDLIL